jgi:hypothetical protein
MPEELFIQIIDGATNESTVRAFNEEELQSYESLQTESEVAILDQETNKAARTSALAKLAALGLTEEEIAAL